MPVYLRNWYIQKLADTFKEEKKQADSQQRKINKPPMVRK